MAHAQGLQDLPRFTYGFATAAPEVFVACERAVPDFAQQNAPALRAFPEFVVSKADLIDTGRSLVTMDAAAIGKDPESARREAVEDMVALINSASAADAQRECAEFMMVLAFLMAAPT